MQLLRIFFFFFLFPLISFNCISIASALQHATSASALSDCYCIISYFAYCFASDKGITNGIRRKRKVLLPQLFLNRFSGSTLLPISTINQKDCGYILRRSEQRLIRIDPVGVARRPRGSLESYYCCSFRACTKEAFNGFSRLTKNVETVSEDKCMIRHGRENTWE